jgi:hypothetical protein
MSLATLKKKTASKYRNNSANLQQFSINGVYRNQGYIGQGSLGRTILRTPAKGTESQGHGGKDGKFLENDVKTSSINSTENNTHVKSSVLSTSGMLAKRNKWAKRPYPYSITNPSDSNNQSTSGDYTVYKRKNALTDGLIMKAFTVTFQSVGREGHTDNDISTDVYILVDGIQIAQITPLANQFTDHSITFYQCKENFTFTLKGEDGLEHWKRTGIANLKINEVSVIDYYNYLITNDTNQGVVNKSLSNTGTTGVPNNSSFRFQNEPKDAIVPTSTNPFIIVSGGDNLTANDDRDPTNHYHIKEFSASSFPCVVVPNKTCKDSYIKSYKEGSECCEKTVQTNTSLGAMSQGDYVFKLISDCAPLDISYVQYNTNLGNPFNTCSS